MNKTRIFFNEEINKSTRLDKYLASKLKSFTRSQIKKIILSKGVKINNKITIKKKHINITIEVKNIISKRVSAKFVTEYINDITPESEKTRFEASHKIPHIYREKGLGRPTKKERRQLMRILENYFES